MFVVNSISARTMSWGKTFSSTLSHVHIQNVSCTRRMKKALLFLVERLAYILSSHLPLELYREMHFHSIHTLMALEILLSYSVFLCVTLIRGWFGAKISSSFLSSLPTGLLGYLSKWILIWEIPMCHSYCMSNSESCWQIKVYYSLLHLKRGVSGKCFLRWESKHIFLCKTPHFC